MHFKMPITLYVTFSSSLATTLVTYPQISH